MIRKLFPYTKGYRLLIVLGVLCSAGEAVLELMLPQAMSDIVDIGIATGDRAYILATGMKMIFMALGALVTLLAGGMLELIRINGGIDWIVGAMTRNIKGKRGAELSIAALVSFANMCTANNTIAIITVGGISSDISKRFGLDPRRVASILDTFSCMVQGIIPYGAQLLLASGLTGASVFSISSYLYYPLVMGVCSLLTILIRKS